MRIPEYFRAISKILIFSMLHLCWWTSYGWAEIMETESALRPSTLIPSDSQRLLELLKRQEVVWELEQYGISPEEATARIHSLSDEEVARIAGQLEELPTGGRHCLFCAEHNEPDDAAAVGLVLVLLLLIAVVFWIAAKTRTGSSSSTGGTYSAPGKADCEPGLESCP